MGLPRCPAGGYPIALVKRDFPFRKSCKQQDRGLSDGS